MNWILEVQAEEPAEEKEAEAPVEEIPSEEPIAVVEEEQKADVAAPVEVTEEVESKEEEPVETVPGLLCVNFCVVSQCVTQLKIFVSNLQCPCVWAYKCLSSDQTLFE